jgi:hypothetical protein
VALIPVNPDPIAVIETDELRLLCSHLPSILAPDSVPYKLYEGYKKWGRLHEVIDYQA